MGKWSKENYNKTRKEYNQIKTEEKTEIVLKIMGIDKTHEIYKYLKVPYGNRVKYAKFIFDTEEEFLELFSEYELVKKK